MTPTNNTRARSFGTLTVRGLLLAAACTFVIAGCQSAKKQAAGPMSTSEFVTVTIDGDTSEWPANTAAYADEHYLYMRFTAQGEQETIQASQKTVTLLIDTDASTATGYVSPLAPMRDLGVDMEVQFSPPGPTGTAMRGMRVSSVDAMGNRSTLSKEDFDIVIAPTYAATWYEARICRTPDQKQGLPSAGLLDAGEVRCMATIADEKGTIVAFSDPVWLKTDGVCPGGRRVAAFTPPAKPANAVRVVSWNVERSKPVQSPEGFARVLRALSPDVVLVQEWETGDGAAMQAWFDANVPSDRSWNVRKAAGDMSNGGGVAVISRYPMTPVLGESLFATYKEDDGKEARRPIRSVAASIDTPQGVMLAVSTHLKSGGSKDSVEDRRRMAEARAINTTFAAVAGATGAPLRVIGGDLNLVGSRPPLDVLRAGLDTDGSDLTPAATLVFGDQAFYSWRDTGSPFAPSRLDWILFSDASAHAENAFVFDVSRLSDEVIASMGLQRGDVGASDHLPSVVDLAVGAGR